VNVPETPAPTLGFVQLLAGNPVQVHPGGAATALNSRYGNPMKPVAPLINALFQSAEMGAAPLLYAATSPDIKTGDFIVPGGIGALKGWPIKQDLHGVALNEELNKRIWSILEEASKVNMGV